MGDVLGRMAAGIFGCIILFIAPIMIIAQKQDSITQNYIDNAVVEFVDNARTSGKITPRAYEELCRKIDTAQVLFEVKIVHSAPYMESVPISVTEYDASNINHVVDTSTTPYSYYELVNMRTSKTKQDILDYMYPDAGDERSYLMKNGDYLKVEVRNITPTLGKRMLSMFIPSGNNTSLYSTYGGLVGNNVQ